MKSKKNQILFSHQTAENEQVKSGLRQTTLAFLSMAPQEIRDAARGKQMILLRLFIGHGTCVSIDCEQCASIMGSGLRELQWVQNKAFESGVFHPSEDVWQARMERAGEMAKAMQMPFSHQDFQKLPQWLQNKITEYFDTQLSKLIATAAKKQPEKESA